VNKGILAKMPGNQDDVLEIVCWCSLLVTLKPIHPIHPAGSFPATDVIPSQQSLQPSFE